MDMPWVAVDGQVLALSDRRQLVARGVDYAYHGVGLTEQDWFLDDLMKSWADDAAAPLFLSEVLVFAVPTQTPARRRNLPGHASARVRRYHESRDREHGDDDGRVHAAVVA